MRRGGSDEERSHGWRERRAAQQRNPQDADFVAVRGENVGAPPAVAEPDVRGPVGGPMGDLLLTMCRRIDGFPRHMGIHSGGMVVTRDPLVRVATVEWATMKDRTIVQWDKDDLSDLGLIKIDLLGLGML